MLMDYPEALKFTHSLEKFGIRLGLGRMLSLLKVLGDPQESLPAVHVAGTNGKGSVCAFLEASFRAEGYKTGLYTSPYVTSFMERIRICNQNADGEAFARAASVVRETAEREGIALTEFEFITACAFLLFRQSEVDRLVLETGLGGRLDATNVLKSPLASVITSVSLDHTQILGDTLAAIAGEKAGIIKSGCPVFLSGGNPREVGDTVTEAAARLGSPLTICPEPSEVEVSLSGTSFSLPDGTRHEISLIGRHQAENAATAVTVLRSLGVGESAVAEGLRTAVNPARFEVISKEPAVILDGGHNLGCAEALRSALESIFGNRKLTFIIGMMKDKDVEGCLSALSPLFSEVFAVTPQNPRSMPACEMAELVRSLGARAHLAEVGEKVIEDALSTGAPVVVCGSLYLAGDIRPLLIKRFQSNRP